jgi:Ca2+:H+ antiporter
MNRSRMLRLAAGWALVAAFFVFNAQFGALAAAPGMLAALSALLFAVILWSAFGVVHEADHLALALGEPRGTLVLTLSIVLIEVALISAATFSSAQPTLGRDTMFAVLMIVLNGVVGLGLLLGGIRHGEQSYNTQGASAYLAVIIPLAVISFVLPNFTVSTSVGTLHPAQAIAFSVFTLILYGVFLVIQTGRHRDFFIAVEEPAHEHGHDAPIKGPAALTRQVLWLLVSIGPVVLLSKFLAKYVDDGLGRLHAPSALGGLLIAVIVLAPEAISAIRAVSANQLTRAVNLCLGASASTIGLTVPAVLCISLITGHPLVLGLSPTNMVLLVLTLGLSMLTFSGPRTTLLEGAMHLMVFFVYVSLIFVA